jgi:glycosyltransferase involved in cell wall biosynthesis
MIDPLVSVLMPVYNGGKYLEYSIRSILSQKYRNFEFVIINDERIIVPSNPINLGQTKSLNVGLRLAKGKYVVINDADDFSLPWRIQRQLDFISSHPEYVVVGSSGFIMDRSGYIYRTFKKPMNLHDIYIGILSDTPVIHGSVIMDREIILEQGGYNEDFKLCQDYELWSSLIRKGFRIINIPDILVVIRHYKDSMSFRETDTQTYENGKTICENIMALTTLEVSLEDAIRQRLFFFAPEVLSKEDFKKAEALFIKEYKSLNSKYIFDFDYVSNNAKNKLEKPYCKLALSEITNGRYKEARRITFVYLKQYGFSRISFLIFLFSFFGEKVSQRIPYMYHMWQKITARVQLSAQRMRHL